MPDRTDIAPEELDRLCERVDTLGKEKSYLELIIGLMTRLNSVAGLDNAVGNLLHGVGEIIGGINLILYYQIDDDVYHADIFGSRGKVDSIDDEFVKAVWNSHEPLEFEHPFADTRMMTPEFTKAYTWVVPLLIGPRLIGVLKMESLHVAMRELSHHLPVFFAHAALVLHNEISDQTRLQKAYDEIQHEVEFRKAAERDLRELNRLLEHRVSERTDALRVANEQLRQNAVDIQRLLDKSELSRVALLSILEDEKRVHEALRRSEERLIRAQAIGHNGSWRLDVAGGTIEWSAETYRMFGVAPGTPVTIETFWECLHGDDRPYIQKVWSAALEGAPYDVEHRIVVGKSVKWVRERAEFVFDDDHRPVEAIGTVQEITERKRAESMGQARLRLLEKSGTLTVDEFLTATLDEIARLTESATAVYRVLDSAGRTVRRQRWYAETSGAVGPALGDAGHGAPADDEACAECLATLRPVIRNDCVATRAGDDGGDGDRAVVRAAMAPILRGNVAKAVIGVCNKAWDYDDNDLAVVSSLGDSAWDIIERKQAEEALRRSEAKYHSLVANADEAIFIVQDGVVKFPNPRAIALTGFTEEQLREIPFADFIHPEDREMVRNRHIERLEHGTPPETYRFRLVTTSGEMLWGQLTVASITWEGRPGTLCFLRDVTEEKKLEAQLIQSQKMEAIGRLAGGVAHDFNNMLSVISGFAELCLKSLREDDPVRDHLKEIRRAGERAAGLTRQLLAFSRKQLLSRNVLNLNSLVDGIVKMLNRLIGEDIDLVTKAAEGLWTIRADAGQIEQVIINLAINARDAMPDGGTLTIETRNVELDDAFVSSHLGATRGPHAMLIVSDTGCGMDQDILPQIFEPFFTTKERGKGTGLGLACVYGIVQQSGGSIAVESEPGRGTTFSLYFPRVDDSRGDAAADRTVAARGHGETVLVVEDEESVRRLVVQILRQGGYRVLQAGNGAEALELLDRCGYNVDLLITDAIMPHMGGRELAQRVTHVRPETRILYASGYIDSTSVFEGLRADQFIQKPFSVEELLARVRKILDG